MCQGRFSRRLSTGMAPRSGTATGDAVEVTAPVMIYNPQGFIETLIGIVLRGFKDKSLTLHDGTFGPNEEGGPMLRTQIKVMIP